MGMLTQEFTQEFHRAPLAHLPEHPSHRLVHQVVRMVQMNLRIPQTPRWITHLRRLPRAHDAHPLFPQAGALRQLIQHLQFKILV